MHAHSVDPYNLWRVDSSLSEGEVAWPQQAATAQDVGRPEVPAPVEFGAALMPNFGYESEGEVQPGISNGHVSPGRVL